jgi:hypothetical protein
MLLMSKGISLVLTIALAFAVTVFPQTAATRRQASSEGVPGAGALLEEAAELRQLKVLRPVRSGTKSRSEIETMIIKDFNATQSVEETEADRKLLIAFRLIAPDFRYREFLVSLLTEQVAGFYESKTKEFFLADWNDPANVKPVIIHELTHALQDQHFDLTRFEKWPRGDADRELAIHALIEGDATAVMFNYVLKPSGLDITRLPMLINELAEAMGATTGGDREKVLASAPPAIRDTLLFPYTYGAAFAQQMLRERKWAGLSRAYTELPQSTEQILHIEKYLARESPTKPVLGDLTGVLGSGWKLLVQDVNGEFGYSVILSGSLTKVEAQRAAGGWGGDRCVLYENSRTGETVLVHLSDWDSVDDASEFYDAYSRRMAKQYNQDGRRDASLGGAVFGDSRGQSYLERRDKRVLAIESLPASLANRLGKAISTAWQ